MTIKPIHEKFVRTPTELTQVWRELMGPEGFDKRSIWHIFFEDDGRMLPLVIPIDDIPAEPDEVVLRNLATIMSEGMSRASATSLAVLLSRPGSGAMSAADRRWARELRATYGPTLCPWPVHLATCNQVRVFAPDDLVAVAVT